MSDDTASTRDGAVSSVSLPMMYRPAMARTEPKTVDEEARTVELTWTTGARVRRSGFFSEDYDEELSLDDEAVDLGRLNSGAPLLNTHDAYDLGSVIGVVERAWLLGPKGRREGRAVVRFSARADVEPIWADVKAGILRNISVGYNTVRAEKIERKGDVPLLRALEWVPMELSVVPIPADARAQVRNADKTVPCVIVNPERQKMDELTSRAAETAAVVTETPKTEASPETRAAQPPAQQTGDSPADASRKVAEEVAKALKADRQRGADIVDAATKLGVKREFADDLVARGLPVDEARRLLIDEAAKGERARPTHPGDVVVVRDADDTRSAAIGNAIMHRYDPASVKLTEAGRDYRSLTLIDMARECLESAGVRTRQMSRRQIAAQALIPGYGVRSGGMLSTSDFPNILADVSNKSLRQAYDQAPRTFQPWARRTTASDFKGINRVALGEAPKLEKVNEHGEYKRGALTEAKETYRLAKWGKVIAITWETVVNDDLDAMTRIPALFGASAANLESDVVYSVLLANAAMADGTALFHANHGNLGSGAIAVAGVSSGRAAMRKQKGIDGTTQINVSPRFMLVPPSIETTAEQLFASITPAQTSNVVPASFRTIVPIAEPRLETGVTVDGTAYSGSAAVWYLAADPSTIDGVEYCYLEGEEGVQLDTRVGFDIDGMETKARLVFAAAAIDFRGVYKSTGV